MSHLPGNEFSLPKQFMNSKFENDSAWEGINDLFAIDQIKPTHSLSNNMTITQCTLIEANFIYHFTV